MKQHLRHQVAITNKITARFLFISFSAFRRQQERNADNTEADNSNNNKGKETIFIDMYEKKEGERERARVEVTDYTKAKKNLTFRKHVLCNRIDAER